MTQTAKCEKDSCQKEMAERWQFIDRFLACIPIIFLIRDSQPHQRKNSRVFQPTKDSRSQMPGSPTTPHRGTTPVSRKDHRSAFFRRYLRATGEGVPLI